MPVVLLGSLALAVGLWLGRAWPELWAAGALAGGIGLLLLWKGRARLVGFVAAFAGAGVLVGLPVRPAPLPAWPIGTLVAAPERRGVETRLIVETAEGARVRLLVTGAVDGVTVGDRVAVRAPVRGLRGFANPDLPDARGPPGGIVGNALVDDPQAIVVAGGARARPLQRVIERARSRVRGVLERGLHEPARGVMRALVLGEGSALDPGAALAYRETGTIHVLAVSGLHVVLVAAALQALLLAGLRRVGWLTRRVEARRVAACAAMPLVAAYTVFAGAGPSAVRAAVMATAVLVARALSRATMASAALGLAAALQLTVWPEDAGDPGLQLSYVAVLGLFVLAAPLQARLGAVLAGDPARAGRVRRWLGKATAGLVAANVAATVVTAPLLAHHFGQLAPISLVANLFAVPLASVVLLPAGLGLSVVALCAPGLADVLCPLLQAPCDALTLLLAATARLPGAHVTVTPPGALATAAMVVLLLSLAWGGLRTRVLRVALIAALALGLPTGTACRGAEQGLVRLTVLDVGQGDASVLELPGGEAVVFDAGGLPGSRLDPGARVVVPYLRARGVHRVAALVVSHPHPDHYGGVPAVAAAMPVAVVWENGQARLGRAGGAFGAILAGLRRKGVPVQGPGELCGHPARFGPVRLDVLGPCPGPGLDEAPNDASLVVRVTHGRVHLLLAGDIETEGEQAILHSGQPLAADLVKVPHHGSGTSSGSGLVEATGARWAVVSVGAWNRFGHPADPVIARWRGAGARVLRTDVDGGVRLVSDGRRLRLEATGRPPLR